jgi:hypothetical protein
MDLCGLSDNEMETMRARSAFSNCRAGKGAQRRAHVSVANLIATERGHGAFFKN